jgi:hypothetical protein
MAGAACSHVVTGVKRAERRECEECVKIGARWVHLRTCQECGTTRCCDSSPNQHASQHARASGHPVVAWAEPGERWGCTVIRTSGRGVCGVLNGLRAGPYSSHDLEARSPRARHRHGRGDPLIRRHLRRFPRENAPRAFLVRSPWKESMMHWTVELPGTDDYAIVTTSGTFNLAYSRQMDLGCRR